jgi:hypothetical protein
MNSSIITRHATPLLVVVALAGCSTWHDLSKPEGTALGAGGGAVAGAVVAGPVGAVVGGVGGAYAGHEVAGKSASSSSSTSSTSSSSQTASRYDAATVRDVQQALNDKGYNAGAIDGQWGPSTEEAVRKFQQAAGLPQTGELEHSTLVALGVSHNK